MRGQLRRGDGSPSSASGSARKLRAGSTTPTRRVVNGEAARGRESADSAHGASFRARARSLASSDWRALVARHGGSRAVASVAVSTVRRLAPRPRRSSPSVTRSRPARARAPTTGFPDNPAAYSAVLASRLGGSSYNFSITGACASAGSGGGARHRRVGVQGREVDHDAADPGGAKARAGVGGRGDDHGRRERHPLLRLLPRAGASRWAASASPGEPDPVRAGAAHHAPPGAGREPRHGALDGEDDVPDGEDRRHRLRQRDPAFVDSKPGSLCSTVRYLYAYELFKKGGAKALAVSLITRRFDKQVGVFQESLYQYAAGRPAAAEHDDSDGRDARTRRPSSRWISPATTSAATTRRAPTAGSSRLVPRATSRSTGTASAAAGRHFDFRPHTLCVPQQPAPACNVDGAAGRVGHEAADPEGRAGLGARDDEVQLLRGAERLPAPDAERRGCACGQGPVEPRPLGIGRVARRSCGRTRRAGRGSGRSCSSSHSAISRAGRAAPR